MQYKPHDYQKFAVDFIEQSCWNADWARPASP